MSDKMSDKMSDNMFDKMSEKEKDRIGTIIEYLEEYHEISSSVAAKLLNVEVKTASRLLSKAEKCGILQGKGKNRTKNMYCRMQGGRL